jgi:hypothetical protein
MWNKRWFRMAVGVMLAAIMAGVAGFLIWALNPPGIEAEAQTALESLDTSRLERRKGLVFSPQGGISGVGLILYPGGRVRPEAYAPLAEAIADRGYLTVIPRMRLNLAVLEIQAADEMMAAYPEVDRWVIGGHSLGGAMAAEYAADQPEKVQGLVLYAAYPAESTDLSERDLEVLSIYATRDGLASMEEVLASADRLPEDTDWVEIEGGNHAGFGWYGPQRGDFPATIQKEEQQVQILEATADFLSHLGGQNGQ